MILKPGDKIDWALMPNRTLFAYNNAVSLYFDQYEYVYMNGGNCNKLNTYLLMMPMYTRSIEIEIIKLNVLGVPSLQKIKRWLYVYELWKEFNSAKTCVCCSEILLDSLLILMDREKCDFKLKLCKAKVKS